MDNELMTTFYKWKCPYFYGTNGNGNGKCAYFYRIEEVYTFPVFLFYTIITNYY